MWIEPILKSSLTSSCYQQPDQTTVQKTRWPFAGHRNTKRRQVFDIRWRGRGGGQGGRGPHERDGGTLTTSFKFRVFDWDKLFPRINNLKKRHRETRALVLNSSQIMFFWRNWKHVVIADDLPHLPWWAPRPTTHIRLLDDQPHSRKTFFFHQFWYRLTSPTISQSVWQLASHTNANQLNP